GLPMSSFDSDGFNRPPAVYDVHNRRRRLHEKRYPGLWWRMRRDGSVVYELKLKHEKRDGSETLRDAHGLEIGDEKTAIARYLELRPAHDRGEQVLAHGDVRGADAARAYFERLAQLVRRGKRSRKTKTTYEGHWRNHIEPVFGHMLLKDVSDDHISAFFADLSDDGLAEWSQCGIKTVLSHLLALAKRKHWITHNPMDDVDPDDLPAQQ